MFCTVDNIYKKYPNINRNNYNAVGCYKQGIKDKLIYGLFDQLLNISQCDKLRTDYEEKNHFKYDLVMKTRFDVLYLSTPKFSEMKINCVYAGLGGFRKDIISKHFPDEIIGIGDSETMKIYSQRISEIYLGKAPVCAHESLAYIFGKYSHISYIPFYFDYLILRSKKLIHHLGKLQNISPEQEALI